MQTTINWISTKERLPKEDGDYLVLTIEDNKPQIALLRFKVKVKRLNYFYGVEQNEEGNSIWYSTTYGDGDYNFKENMPDYWTDIQVKNYTA